MVQESLESTSDKQDLSKGDKDDSEKESQAGVAENINTNVDLNIVNSDGTNLAATSFSSTKTQVNISSYLPKKISTSSKKKLDADLLVLFIYDYQPFSIVEDKGFKTFVNRLNPSNDLPNRHTISGTMIPLEYEKCFQEAKEEIKDVVNICLTTDCWTSAKNESFMAVTGHFIDKQFKMNSVLLSCDKMEENHTSVNLAARLKQVVTEWSLENKVILCVSDNASNIKSAIANELGWKYFGCFAHTLNLTVQDALKIVKDIIEKIKTIVSHFRRSTIANSKLENFQKQFGIDQPKKLIQDVATRWNSTFTC